MYIHVYTGTPTAGGTDGILVSEGDNSAPLQIGPLNCATSQEIQQKMSIRCDAGYTTLGTTTITPNGLSASKWALAPDSAGAPGVWGAYGATLSIAVAITNVNRIFWIKAKATPEENPTNDTSVKLNIGATIQAV